MRRYLKMLLASLLTIGIAGYAALMLLALSSDRIIFQPHASSYHLEGFQSQAIRTFRIPVGDAEIAAIYLPNADARYTLLYSHGNAEDIGDDLPIFEEFRRAGFSVFAYDYEGYGASSGRPSEKALHRDVEAAYDHLTKVIGVAPQQVIAHGHSLGAAAAIHLASARPVAGLIADAPFLSAFRVFLPTRILPWDAFDNARTIRNVHCPVLVIHGRRDEVVPFWHGKRIYELANYPKQNLWIDNAGHNDAMIVAPEAYIRAMQDFARSLESGQVGTGK